MYMYAYLGVLTVIYKKVLCIVIAVCIGLLLCGCKLFTVDTDELLSPPQLTGDAKPIQQALNKSVQEYTLKYPSSGDRRSAVITEDIDSDGSLEALAFYSTDDGEQIKMNVNILRKGKKGWRSVATSSIVAGGVDRVEFSDIDADGIKEILIGWEIYGSSDKQLAVYSFKNKTLLQRMLKPYTQFVCCDLDENGFEEIYVQLLNTAEGTNNGLLYSIGKDGVSQIAGCIMDGTVKTVNTPKVSVLSTGKPAIYIDEVKGAGAITEVLVLSKGELINGMLDTETTLENNKTIRPSSLPIFDINDDGIPEIPIAKDLPSADETSSEKLYYTDWCSYNGETLTVKLTTIVNQLDGYYIEVPEKWFGKIAVLKDTDKNLRVIYSYDTQNGVIGEKTAQFKAVSEDGYNIKSYRGYTEILKSNGKVFIGKVLSENKEFSVTSQELKKMFNVIQW